MVAHRGPCLTLNTPLSQIFLQGQEDPYMEFFRKLLHKAYSRSGQRGPASPSQAGGGGAALPPKRCPADFQLTADDADWLAEGTGEDVFASPTSTPGGRRMLEEETEVRLMLAVPPPPAEPPEEHEHPSPGRSPPSSAGKGLDLSVSGALAHAMAMQPRRASAPALASPRSSLPGGAEAQNGQEARRGAQGGAAAEVGAKGEAEAEGAVVLNPTMESPTKDGTGGRRRTSKHLANLLLASPNKLERRTHSLEEFEIDRLMRQKGAVSTPWLSSRRPVVRSADLLGDSSQAGDVQAEGAAGDWRDPRRFTVEEAASMMQVGGRRQAWAVGRGYEGGGWPVWACVFDWKSVCVCVLPGLDRCLCGSLRARWG
jgi:hypothetical protein